MIVWLIGGALEYLCKLNLYKNRYEMLNALPPFYHENIEKMYELIKSSDIKFSKRVSVSDDAKDLIIKVSTFK